jgi:hypothetical protein
LLLAVLRMNRHFWSEVWKSGNRFSEMIMLDE